MDAINPDHYKRLPAEAIDIIESAIEKCPSNQDAYLHGQALKYLLRCWHKNGIEDLRKAKWYLDRLIEHCDESLLDANKPAKPPKEQPQLPDGWRWLNEDEVIRKGDGYRYGGKWWDYDNSIGAKVRDTVWPSIRRNRFEVGEKVVECVNNRIGVVNDIEAIGSGKYFLYVEMQDTKGVIVFSPNKLAPYIEEAT